MNEQLQSSRFITNDETSFDNRTELTWTKEDAVDRDVGFDERQTIADEFNAKAFAGFTDWRVPEIGELQGITEYTKFNPAIDTDAFPNCKPRGYWANTPDAEDPSDAAWVQGFGGGHSNINLRNSRFRLRLVRGPSRQ